MLLVGSLLKACLTLGSSEGSPQRRRCAPALVGVRSQEGEGGAEEEGRRRASITVGPHADQSDRLFHLRVFFENLHNLPFRTIFPWQKEGRVYSLSPVPRCQNFVPRGINCPTQGGRLCMHLVLSRATGLHQQRAVGQKLGGAW